MTARVGLMALALAMTPLIATAADEAPQLSCIKDVKYSQEFLQKNPKAPAACREVVVKDGAKWIHFVGEVTERKGNQVTIDFQNVAGDPLATIVAEASPDARLKIGDKKVKYSSLRAKDKIDVWMPESRFGFYAEPGQEMSQLKVVERK